MKHRVFCRCQVERHGKVRVSRFEAELTGAGQPQNPVINPSNAVTVGKSRLTEGAARHLLGETEPPVRNVRDREMSQLDVIDGEPRARILTASHSLTKKGQLESEFASVLPREVSREIPPLCLEPRMRLVIAGELVFPSRQSNVPVRIRSWRFRRGHSEQQSANKAAIHAAPPLPRSSPTPSSVQSRLRFPRSGRFP